MVSRLELVDVQRDGAEVLFTTPVTHLMEPYLASKMPDHAHDDALNMEHLPVSVTGVGKVEVRSLT